MASSEARTRAAVLGLTAAQAAMVLFDLGAKSVWQDEAYTWSAVSRSWSGFVALVRGTESQNLLYSGLMFLWVRVGDTEAFLRLPSAVFAILTVPAMYLAGRALFDRRVGVVAALLFAVNANAVQFGQEARAYTLAMLLGALSIAGFATAVRRPSRKAWFGWVVPSALLIFTHPYAIFVVVAELTSLLFLRPLGAARRRFATGALVIGLVAAPMLVLLATQEDSTSTAGLPPAAESARYVTGLFGKAGMPLVLAWLALLAYGAWATVRAWPSASRVTRWQLATVWCLPLVTISLVGAIALALDVLRPPHVLIALPAFVLAGAASLCRVRSHRWFVGTIALIVALSLVGVVKWDVSRPKQGWRAATAYVLEHASPGDAVVFAADIGRIPFEYYARHDRRRDALVPAYPAAPWGTWGTGDQHNVFPGPRDMARISATNRRIWIVMAAAKR
ncbi:MAG: mannosyltransferase, partial [Actinomycetota bacterium]|nr:mannosyltransferase [Actinomycetota bacterium]